MEKAVDFFIIGAQKSGTTALDTLIRRHPSIQMAGVKEVHFFDDETLDWPNPQYQKLHDNFDWKVNGVLRGETTPIYIYWPKSLARLYSYNPHAKLILLLRQPGHRAFSHWRMERSRDLENLEFDAAISTEGRRRVNEAEGGVHRVYSYIERGFYSEQIERLLDIFPSQQVYFLRTDRMWQRPAKALEEIAEFLGVGKWDHAPSEQEYIVPLANANTPFLTTSTREKLGTIFHSDIKATANLTGLDLDDWLDPHNSEPMKASKRSSSY